MRLLIPLIYIAALLLLVACASVPDKALCVPEFANDVHGDRGYCNYTLSNKPFYVDDSLDPKTKYVDSKGRVWSWSELQMIAIIMPPETWGALDGFIEKVCHENPGRCGDVGQWKGKSDFVKKHLDQNQKHLLDLRSP